MKRNSLLISILFFMSLICISLAYAQLPTEPKTKQAGENYVFRDKAPLKVLPDIESLTLLELNEGEEVEILSESEETIEWFDVINHWYRVSARDETGYMWGGHLSDMFIVDNLNYDYIQDKVLIRDLTTLGRSVYEEDAPHKYELKLFQGDYLSSVAYKEDFAELNFTGYRIYENEGFIPRVKLFSLRYVKYSEELEYDGAEDFFYIHKGKLYYAFTYIPVEDNCNTKIYFPNDEGGQPNKVIMKTTCRIPEGYEETLVYEWDKREFRIVGGELD